jgi:RNA polymerase sigma factor (TIGR02999 family)
MAEPIPESASTDRGPGVKSSAERNAFNQVFSLVYEELRTLAAAVRHRESGITLSSTALVHEAWMKLKNSPHLAAINKAHFKAIAARAMRQVLVEAARRRHSQKRDNGYVRVELNDFAANSRQYDEDVLSLESALARLATVSPRQAQMVECRFYGGLSVAETAEALGVSESAIERDWRSARAWLASALRPGMELGNE